MEESEEELRRRIRHFIIQLRQNGQAQPAHMVADRLFLCLDAEEIREPPFAWTKEQVNGFKVGDTAVVYMSNQPPWYGVRYTLSKVQPNCGGVTLYFTDPMARGGKGEVVGHVGWSRIDPRSVHSLDADEVFDEDSPFNEDG